MTKKKEIKSSFETCSFGFGMGALLALAQGMTPECIMDGIMKKRGFKPRKTEKDVEALAAAADKRARRGERNRRNAAAMAEGQILRGTK